VIGIAAGTVVLPTMSRRLAAGDEAGAHAAQNRAASFALVLSAPFAVAFILVPDLVMRGLFMRGAFDAQSAAASGAVLAAYAVGLPAVVLIRSAVAAFFARHDTATPLIASFSGIAVNLLLKLALFSSMGAAGLALATAVGAWVNVTLLVLLAWRRHWIAPDRALGGAVTAACAASLVLAVIVLVADGPIERAAAGLPAFRTEAHLVALGLLGMAVYGIAVLAGLKALRVPFRRI
jgi:putative peptidoglycan lipid II flippase